MAAMNALRRAITAFLLKVSVLLLNVAQFPVLRRTPDAYPDTTLESALTQLLADFLRPLDRALPALFMRWPVLFHRMNQVMARRIAQAPAGTLAAVIDEVLRLYPAGWIGSRRCTADTEFDGIRIRRGTLVLYSPYLTHRDPQLWTDPLSFRPERFPGAIPPWGFIPFAAGERTCLRRSYARLVFNTVLDAIAGGELRFTAGDLRPRAGITLAPAGPVDLVLHR
jgi:cytochrome P450